MTCSSLCKKFVSSNYVDFGGQKVRLFTLIQTVGAEKFVMCEQVRVLPYLVAEVTHVAVHVAGVLLALPSRGAGPPKAAPRRMRTR